MNNVSDMFGQYFGPLQQSVEKIPERITEQARQIEYERLRTRKAIRFPLLNGAAVSGVLTLGGDTGEQLIGPESGYVWSVRELNIEGLTSGGTPDVVNFYRNVSNQGRIFWQLNGNVFCQTFGRGEKILYGGEHLLAVSVGTFAATGTITVTGLAEEVAAERIGEFY